VEFYPFRQLAPLVFHAKIVLNLLKVAFVFNAEHVLDMLMLTIACLPTVTATELCVLVKISFSKMQVNNYYLSKFCFHNYFLLIIIFADVTFRVIEVCHTDDIFFCVDRERFLHKLTAFVVTNTNSDYLSDPIEFCRILREAIATQTFAGAHGVYAVTIDQLCTHTQTLFCHIRKKGLKCTAGNMVQGAFGMAFVDQEDPDELCASQAFEYEDDENQMTPLWIPVATVEERRGPDDKGRQFCAYLRSCLMPFRSEETRRLVIDANDPELKGRYCRYTRCELSALAEQVVYLLCHKSVVKVR
jgi:hypothetical protein